MTDKQCIILEIIIYLKMSTKAKYKNMELGFISLPLKTER